MAIDPRSARGARRKVRRMQTRLQTRLRRYRAQEKASKQYDPLAPITGAREKQEMGAAERLQFGQRASELRQAIAGQEQTTADRARYYDDWRQALRESTARVNESNRQNVEATEGRVDSAYAQDKSAVAARDAAASDTASKLGRAPVQSNEGARAVEAQRSQGNQSAARLREQAGADTKYLELRGVNASQAKTEDQTRLAGKREQLRKESSDLARDRGDFRVDFRRKTRQDEREYAAVQKEFGLKERGQDLQYKNTVAQRKLEREKIAGQKIIARMYSSADRASARAQVRVAKLQLEKGKISQKQYREIVNIYKGLPGGGGGGGGKNTPNSRYSGPGGTMAPWERRKVESSVQSLINTHAGPGDRQRAIQALIKRGVPADLARVAWRRYAAKHIGKRPDTSGNPNVGG